MSELTGQRRSTCLCLPDASACLAETSQEPGSPALDSSKHATCIALIRRQVGSSGDQAGREARLALRSVRAAQMWVGSCLTASAPSVTITACLPANMRLHPSNVIFLFFCLPPVVANRTCNWAQNLCTLTQ